VLAEPSHWRELADTVAGRAVAIGSWLNGQADALISADSEPVAPGPLQDQFVLDQLVARLTAASERTREHLVRVADADPVSEAR
jgi:DNA-binding ferritin-like protein